jgi:hypothetical protein
MTMTKKIFSVFSIACIAAMISCGSDDELDCTGVAPKYNSEVNLILSASCGSAGCHDVTTKSAGVDLSSYAASVAATKSDKFLKSIKHESGASKMPQGGDKLPDATIKVIECWIKNGTPQ